jgi:hypothetical protein
MTAAALSAAGLCAAAALLADIQFPSRVALADSALRAPIPKPAPTRYGLLWLDLDPADAQVSLDGVFLDVDVWLISMAPGRHEISIRKQGFLPMDRSVGISAGENVRLALRLEKDSVFNPVATVPPALPHGSPGAGAN